MKLFIPKLGDRIRLTDFWVFHLFKDRRHDAIFAAMGRFLEDLEVVRIKSTIKKGQMEEVYKLPLPPGTILKVDRIYIRRNQEDWNSVTFVIEDTTHPILKSKKRGKQRFWATLNDVNKIECELALDKTPKIKKKRSG